MIDMQNMNVLIADDMENMCKAIRGILKVLKISGQVFYAFNGLDAWKILERGEQIDLAIIDWNMPAMTGAELLAKIRDDRRFRDLPVVMVTAEANKEIVAEAAESDIDAYILKPLTVKTLEDRIMLVIDRANNPPPMNRHLKMSGTSTKRATWRRPSLMRSWRRRRTPPRPGRCGSWGTSTSRAGTWSKRRNG
jgi:CheY-like chemotaxis protein